MESPREGLPTYGGLWRRFWARLIDFYAVLGILTPLSSLAFVVSRNFAIVLSLLSLIGPFYFVICHYRWGRTVGKHVLGVIVKSANGGKLSFGQALLRSLVEGALAVTTIAMTVAVLLHTTEGQYSNLKVLDRLFLQVGGTLVAGPLFFLWGLANAVTLVANRRKRAIHDFMARSHVVVVNASVGSKAKKEIAKLLLLSLAAHMFLLEAIRRSSPTAGILAVIGTACYLIVAFFVVQEFKSMRETDVP